MTTLKRGSILAAVLAALLAGMASAAPLPGAGSPAQAFTVRPGDCLWTIAARPEVFGDPWQWPRLFDANRDRIHDPDLIEPGWRLNVPPAPTAAERAEARLFAQQYKESVAAPPELAERVAEAPASAVQGAPETAQPVPVPAPRSPWRWGLALAVLVVLAAAYARVRRRAVSPPSLAKAEPLSQPVAALPSAMPAPAPPTEPSASGPGDAVAAPEASVPPLPAAAQPTESEAIVRAEKEPDPLHPEQHPKAA